MPEYIQKTYNSGSRGFSQNRNGENGKEEIPDFGLQFLSNFNNFETSLTMDFFENYLIDDLNNFDSNSSLRNVYETYLKICNNNDFEIEFNVLIARTAYQEKRKSGKKTILPKGFAKFLESMYKKIGDKDKFEQFLEVLVAYHKYFNSNAK